jgi:hypothetical protein
MKCLLCEDTGSEPRILNVAIFWYRCHSSTSKLISRPGTPLVLVNHFDCVSANAV